MADENNQNQGQQNNDDQEKKSDKGTESKEDNKTNMVPHAALHSEREEHKKTKERLKLLETQREEAERKAEEEKGNFKKLYEESKTQLDSLTSELTKTKDSLKLYEDAASNRIEAALSAVKSEEDKGILQDALNGKSLPEKENILSKLLPKFITSTSVNESAKGSDKKEENDDKQVNKDKAKKSGDLIGMLRNAPVLNK